MERIYIFTRFERFWHWSQAALIILMLLTGFEVHGTYSLIGWEKAASLHTTAAWALIGLWILAIFWHFTTGEWKQYIPTTERMGAVLRHYAFGIFTGAPHPFHATRQRKHNPLQRLAYLWVKLMINPLIWASGLVYLYYKDLARAGVTGTALPLSWVAVLHTAAAFMMLIFLIIHVYFATTGRTPFAYLRAMLTGWEEAEEDTPARTAAGRS